MLCSHVCKIEPHGVRVGRNAQLARPVRPEHGDGVTEKPRPYATPDVCGQHPEMLELARRPRARERVEARQGRAADRAPHWMAR